MDRIVRTIRVKDGNGVGFNVIERERRDTVPVINRTRKMVRFELETGEPGSFVDEETFQLTRTGEKFLRVHRRRRVREST